MAPAEDRPPHGKPMADAGPALPARLPLVDMARGAGILLMFCYHFSWDLTYFGFADFALFTDAGWLAFRAVIVCTFLSVAGLSQVLAQRHGFTGRPFLKRLAVVGASAAAITVATAVVFPDGFIFFGILHNLTLAAVLVLAFMRLPAALVATAALAVIAAPLAFAAPLFDRPALQWLGLMTMPANSVDYVPVMPWFGVVLLGVAAGKVLLDGGPRLAALAGWDPSGRPAEALRWLGRHSLVLYLVHQPVFFAVLYGVQAASAAGP